MNLYKNRYVKYLIWRLILKNPELRIRLQKLLYGSGRRSVRLLGQPMELDAQHEIGYVRAAALQTHNVLLRDEIPQLLTVMSFVDDGVTFVDVGANVGFWSVTAASIARTHRDVRVIAFEANPDTATRLRHNLSPFAEAVVHNVAISDRSEELTFYEGATSGVFSTQKGDFNTSRSHRVAAEPLTGFIAGATRLVVKIDVEGHEAPVLRGLRPALEQDRVRAVFIDGYDPAAEQEILAMLQGFGFRLYDAHSRLPFAPRAGHVPLLAVKDLPKA